ncbi:MAG: choice-of-anchor J domain-containing protein [Bacteroidales bacterium]|nr:choice-of-anchor J domain-containing protein [Bacteroidales bacterium]
MKRILLLTAITAFLFSGVFAQNFTGKVTGKIHHEGRYNKVKAITGQTKSTTILAEDFSGGVLPTGWQNVDNATGGVWSFTNPGEQTINTTTNANGFVIFDSDFLGSDGAAENADLITSVLDCSGYTTVILTFEHYFYAGYDGAAEVLVSADNGSNWTSVGAWAATSTANAELFTANISSIAAGQSQVMVKWNWQGDYSWYWAVDDVLIYAPDANDLSVVGYSPVFLNEGSSAFPAVTVLNVGADVQNDFDITVVINDGTTDVYTSTLNVTGAALASFAQDEFVMTDEWTTPANGSYTITATVVLTGDANTDNDEMSGDCLVGSYFVAQAGNSTDFTYGNVDLTTGAYSVVGAITTDPFPMAEEYNGVNVYRVYNDFTYGIVNPVGDYTPIGTMSGVAGTPTGLAYDFNAAQMYIVILDAGNLPQLCTVDLGTGVCTLIGTGTEGMIIGMDFAMDGYLYGPDLNDNLYKIDPATGAVTLIGAVGIDLNYGQDVSYDFETDRLYTVSCGAVYAFGYYDLTTGAFTSVLDMEGDQYATFVITKVPSGPIAISHLPLSNATGVELDAEVSVTFNVNVFEVDFAGITIVPDPGNLVVSIVDDVLTIAHDNFAYNTLYTVTLPAGCVDDGADGLYSDLVWSFTTMLDPTACNDPSDIIISDISINGATVSWTENGIGTEWTVVYGPTGFDPATEGDQVTADATTIALTELDADTEYDVYVQAVCGGLTSGWAGPVAFTTLFDCGPAITALPYTNTFDAADPCWLIAQFNAAETWQWEVDQYVCYYDEALGNQDEWLISPEFNLSGVTDNLAVNFNWLASYAWSVTNDNYDMFLKVTTDGTNWTELWDETVAGTFTDWTEYLATVNVSAYAGQSSVRFAFNYVGSDGAQWSVLDFSLEIVSGNEIENSNQISIYPNPSNGFVNINVTENSLISVIDIAGRVVESFNVNANEEVKFSQSAGLYIVKVESNGKVSTHKLIIQ